MPLDYDDLSAGETTVAYIQHPSNHTGAEDILINPGGPGSSGVATVLQAVQTLRTYLGHKHNIIGFDPRGVNNSGLRLDCLPDAPAVAQYYDSQILEHIDPESDASVSEAYALADGFGQLCSNAHRDDNVGYANSVAVAGDMLHFAKLRAPNNTSEAEPRVNYYGASYGTALGTAFATLYPGHVGRFVLDGVVDAEDYFTGGWRENLIQADESVRAFSKFCFDAKEYVGPGWNAFSCLYRMPAPIPPSSTSQRLMLNFVTASKCAFFNNDTSVGKLQARFDAILSDIKENPIAFYEKGIVDYPAVITIRDLNYWLFIAVYDSVAYFPLLATVMAELEHRDASILVSITTLGRAPESSCDFTGLETSAIQTKSLIQCHDADGRYLLDSPAEWADHVSYLVNQSAYLGAGWAFAGGICRTYDIRAPRSQVFGGYEAGTKTATPMLFVRNTLDPVTPAAEKMRRFFDDSVLLTLDAVGHSAIRFQSQCMSDSVRSYFEDGVLPEDGLVCKTDVLPFLGG